MAILSDSPNHFLSSLSAEDFRLLQPHLRPLDMPQGKILYRAEDIIETVYFPETGLVSIVVGLKDGQVIEAGVFGKNGVVGSGALLDGQVALNQAISQVGGQGLAGNARELKGAVMQSDTLRSALAKYDQLMIAQAQQGAACNARHSIEERLSRWLLQTRDVVEGDYLPLTQEFLSQMLGVQRSSVTLVARQLQQAGLVAYKRGHVEILDVGALRETCCECYETLNAHFLRQTGWAPKGN